MRRAVDHYLSSTDGIKVTADMFEIPPSTLRGYINKMKKVPWAIIAGPTNEFIICKTSPGVLKL
jgi:hypothetical protein